MTSKKVQVLITWDVDPDRWARYEERKQALNTAISLCSSQGIKSTFFITANFAHEYPDQISQMKVLGQEIGCHGLTHTDEEDYDKMPAPMQRDYIAQATAKLQAAVGEPIKSFRSPRVKTSATTLKILSELGYQADSTVCSQRIDFVSSNLVNPGWIFAPRTPYHPDQTNAFSRGSLPIWEIPVSAIILPFISGSLNIFGLNVMKLFFRALYLEARYLDKPIVYLAHPPELVPIKEENRQHRLTQKFSLSQIRTHGFLLRRKLYRMQAEDWLENTRRLFAYMASFPDVVFPTCCEYSNYLNQITQKSN